MGGLQKEIGFDVHHLYEPNKIKTRPIMVEKSQNLGNEIKTRRGDSRHHIVNKGRRSNMSIYEYRYIHNLHNTHITIKHTYNIYIYIFIH